MTTDKIVMWVTQLSIVDWVYFKTQTLLMTLRTLNQPQGEHVSPSAGCATNKLLSRTILQSLKSSRWMLDYEWMDYLLSTSGMW